MAKNKKKGGGVVLWSVLTGVSAVAFGAACVGTNLANASAQAVNIALKTSTNKTVGKDDSVKYFETGFDSVEDLEAHDKEIAEQLTHPSYNKKKIYQVILDKPLEEADKEKILTVGLDLNDGNIKADELEYIDAEDHRRLGIEIHSGKNRIVRRIFESLGYDVKALDRVYFAGLTKKGLKKGEWRYLSEGEVNVLKMGAYV